MVFGTGMSTGSPLIKHPDVSAISFTGSTLTATKIREACVGTCKKLSLEVGFHDLCDMLFDLYRALFCKQDLLLSWSFYFLLLELGLRCAYTLLVLNSVILLAPLFSCA